MCGAKGHGFLAVLIWNKVSILTILVWNKVWFVRSSLELAAHYGSCFIVWSFKLETLYSFVSNQESTFILSWSNLIIEKRMNIAFNIRELIIRQVWNRVSHFLSNLK